MISFDVTLFTQHKRCDTENGVSLYGDLAVS